MSDSTAGEMAVIASKRAERQRTFRVRSANPVPNISETLMEVKGISGNTPADLREVAAVWEQSASYCDICGEPKLAIRDRRFASAMREAASILEALRMDS